MAKFHEILSNNVLGSRVRKEDFRNIIICFKEPLLRGGKEAFVTSTTV